MARLMTLPNKLKSQSKGWRFQTMQTGLGMVVLQAMTFITGIMIARGLGPAGQGRYQLLISVALFVTMFGKLGLDEAAAYILPKMQTDAPEKVPSLVAYLLLISSAIGLLLASVLVLLAPWLEASVFKLDGFSQDIRYLLGIIPALLLMIISLSILRGLGRSDVRAYVYYYGVGGLFLVLTAVLYFTARTQMSPERIYQIRTASFGFGAFASIAFLYKQLPRTPINFGSLNLRRVHTFAGWLIFVSLLQYMIEQPFIDLIIAGQLVSEESLGIYSVGARVGSLVAIGLNAMTIVLGPKFAKSFVDTESATRNQLYNRASFALAYMSLFIGFSLIIARHTILNLFGSEYQQGSIVLIIFAAGYMVMGLFGLNTPLLLAHGQQKVEFVLAAIATTLMVVLNYVLGVRFGIAGIALATAGTIAGLAIGRYIISTKKLHIKLNSTHSKYIFIAGTAGFVCLGIQNQFTLTKSVIASSLLICAYLILLGGLFNSVSKKQY